MQLPQYMTTVTPLSKRIALALFIILPFISFYLGVQYQKLQVNAEVILIQPSVEPKASNTATQSREVFRSPLPSPSSTSFSDTLGSGLYNNSKYKISFRYPSRLKLAEENRSSVTYITLKNNQEEYQFELLNTKSETLLSHNPPNRKEKINGITWDVHDSFEYCDAGSCGPTAEAYITRKGDLLVTFMINKKGIGYDPFEPLYKFKFAETNPGLSTLNGTTITYSNAKFGYSFNYPSSYNHTGFSCIGPDRSMCLDGQTFTNKYDDEETLTLLLSRSENETLDDTKERYISNEYFRIVKSETYNTIPMIILASKKGHYEGNNMQGPYYQISAEFLNKNGQVFYDLTYSWLAKDTTTLLNGDELDSHLKVLEASLISFVINN